MDPDQTAPLGVVRSGLVCFCGKISKIFYLSGFIVFASMIKLVKYFIYVRQITN